jgi:uncharacterized protein
VTTDAVTSAEGSDALLVPGGWRPLPTPSWLTAPFWAAAGEGRLIVQRCTECAAYVFRPQYACTRCLSTDLEWVDSSGTGTLHSFSIVKRPAYPELPEPYVVIVVQMDEGWSMMSNLIDCSVADVRIGMALRVAFRDVGGMSLPFMGPA